MGDKSTVNDLFPDAGKLLLTGGGKEFVERIGIEATKQAILNVMTGQNLRTQTEPLSQHRIAILSGAIISLFAKGFKEIPGFSKELSSIAVEQIKNSKKSDKASMWTAQWMIGLTGKSFENVLRGDHGEVERYLKDFEDTLTKAAKKCAKDFGDLRMTLGFVADENGHRIEIGWEEIARITTAISMQTLTIRGSEKSLYGKLFEKLILGSYLTILGFERVNHSSNTKTEGVFWLSDSSDLRESDATLLIKPNRLARFDLGFIGKGNPEISKDKLSRYANEYKSKGVTHSSVTFIIVDRLPEKSKKTEEAAKNIKAEIVQMSMQFWVKDLAKRLGNRVGVEHELQTMDDGEILGYLSSQLEGIPVEDFLSDVSIKDLQEIMDDEESEEQEMPAEAAINGESND